MAKIERFEDIESWKTAREICADIWKIMNDTSLSTDYRLKDQMNGSSGSIMDNIAEGFERNGNKEFIQFLSIAKASCGELRSQLYRCLDRGHINKDLFQKLLNKIELISMKIAGLIKYLKNSDRKGFKYD